jgi:hypothetical protein
MSMIFIPAPLRFAAQLHDNFQLRVGQANHAPAWCRKRDQRAKVNRAARPPGQDESFVLSFARSHV